MTPDWTDPVEAANQLSIAKRISELEERQVHDDLMLAADLLTNGERRTEYGDPMIVFNGYAKMWTVLLRNKLQPGIELEATDVTLCMAALKLARESQRSKSDNVVDLHGYMSIYARLRGWFTKR